MSQKFTLATLALACMTALSANAADKLLVSNAGTTSEFSLAEVSTLTFADGNLNVFSTGETSKFTLTENLVIKFASTSGVENVIGRENAAILAYREGMLVLDGSIVLVNAQIFNVAGSCLRIYENWDGSPISTDELPNGVYIAKAGQQTLKFVK